MLPIIAGAAGGGALLLLLLVILLVRRRKSGRRLVVGAGTAQVTNQNFFLRAAGACMRCGLRLLGCSRL
jgi:hypothetical protein